MIDVDSNVLACLYLPGEHTAAAEALLEPGPDWGSWLDISAGMKFRLRRQLVCNWRLKAVARAAGLSSNPEKCASLYAMATALQMTAACHWRCS
jgi:hypothetical protein